MATIAPQRSYTCEQRTLDPLEPSAAHQMSFPRCEGLRAATRRRGSQSCSHCGEFTGMRENVGQLLVEIQAYAAYVEILAFPYRDGADLVDEIGRAHV